MANRQTLHINHLPKLKSWLKEQGWELQPITNIYEVIRAKKGKDTMIVYKKLGAKEHLSVMDKDYKIIKQFLADMRGEQE